MIVRRPGEDEREVLDEGVIDTVLPGVTSTRRLVAAARTAMSPGSDVMIWSPWSARATSLAVRTATPARGRQHSSVPTSAIGPNRHGAAPLERSR